MRIIFVLILTLLTSLPLFAKDYSQYPQVIDFMDKMASEDHFDRAKLTQLFQNAKYQEKALAAFVPALRPKTPHYKSAQERKQGPWDRYEEIYLKSAKVVKGVDFMKQNHTTLQKVYEKYGVEPEYITAIIGIESHYGEHTGKFPVFDTLTTLAFEENRRQRFFRSELREFLLMTQKEDVDPTKVMGSYAGAIGLGQFMPSNYEPYAVDFNGDGKKRIHNTEDAIGSVANYLALHRWRKGEPVAARVSYPGKRYEGETGYKQTFERASLKDIAPKYQFDYDKRVSLIKLKRFEYDELWYGAHNFYVITRYNHSGYYAMAVYQLAQRIKERYKDLHGALPR